ncbi:Gypsy retrotransposon integrase-like protein 1, partial [Marasmius crinis-equi]
MPGNVCSHCLTLRAECTHVSVKKKRGPPKGTPRGQKTVPTLVKSILSTEKPFVIPEDPESIRQILVALANRIVALEEQLEEKEREGGESPAATGSPSMMSAYYTPASSVPSPRAGDETDASASATGLARDVVKQLKLEHTQTRHFGQSSNMELLVSAIDLNKDAKEGGRVRHAQRPVERIIPISRRPEFWSVHPWQIGTEQPPPQYTFPDDDLMCHLLNLYFAHIHPFFPIIHRGLFEKSISEGLHHRDLHFAAVTLAVCATASRLSDDSRVLDPEDRGKLSAGWKWFRQIRLVRPHFITPPSIYELQLCSIATYFVQGTTRAETSWVMLGLGVRFAQELGIHRRPPPESELTIESQMRNRAFWGLISIDTLMSSFLGRPRATHTDDFDLPPPIECDDEYWDIDNQASDQAFNQPPGEPSNISYWVSLLKLLDIVGFTQRTIYAVRKTDLWTRAGMSGAEWNEKIVAELDSALNSWADTVPPHLKWDPNNPSKTFFAQSTILYVTYYWVQILIHKQFLSSSDEEERGVGVRFPSMTICANAARSAIHLTEVYHRREESPSVFPTVIKAIYSSAVVLYLNAWRGTRTKTATDPYRELGDVYRCLEILRRYEKITQVAGRFCDILNHLLSGCNLPPKRRQLEEEDEGYEDQDANTSDSVSRLLTTHPRPIAGSIRTGTGTFDTHAQAEFSLPISTSDLGSLPLHESFPGGDFDMGWSDQFQFLGGGGEGIGAQFGGDVDAGYTNGYMAGSLPGEFGKA